MKNGTKLGTIAYMPAVSGLLCASYVINDIIDSSKIETLTIVGGENSLSENLVNKLKK